MNEHISIKRKDKDEDYYAWLQEQSIKEVQRLSGKIWTDYNAHDPGVTILEALNYSLLEMDYRLQFNLEDYLTPAGLTFNPSDNGLFSPLDVFPVNPVTKMDYRKLFLSSVDNLINIWPVVHRDTGVYDFLLDVSPDTTETRKEEIVGEVTHIYHAHRNLCENLGNIRFLEHKYISLQAVVDIGEHEDANIIMARIYMIIQDFLSGGVRFQQLNELLENGKTLDEILDGPLQKRMVIDEDSLREQRTEFDSLRLFRLVREVPGINSIISMSLQIDNTNLEDHLKAEPWDELTTSYVMQLPEGEEQGKDITIRKKGKEVSVEWELVKRAYLMKRLSLYGSQNHTTDKGILHSHPDGIYRDISYHHPIRYDFPACYQKADQLHRYLGIFDNLLMDSLNEVKELPYMMRLDTNDVSDKKEQLLNMFDCLYGEESNPTFLDEDKNYKESRIRRSLFLSQIPEWGYSRGTACNLLDFSENSISGIESYVKGMRLPKAHELEMYLIEHTLLHVAKTAESGPITNSFTISIVFSAKDECVEDAQFRYNCEQLVQKRVPAHIRADIYWLGKENIRSFKNDYFFWRYLLSTERKTGLDELSEKIKKMLNDDNYWYSKVRF